MEEEISVEISLEEDMEASTEANLGAEEAIGVEGGLEASLAHREETIFRRR